MNNLTIRSLPLEEIGEIQALWQALVNTNGQNSPYFADYYATFTFSVRCGFLQEKKESGQQVETWLVQEEGTGEKLGFCTITYHPVEKFGELEMLYLSENLRGQGLGSRLLKLALDRFAEQKIDNLKLAVTYGNTAALRLYEKFGFYPFTIDCLKK